MFNKTYAHMGAAFTAGILANSSAAFAQSITSSTTSTSTGASSTTTSSSGGNNFSAIAENMAGSIGSLPGLISAIAYLFGVLIGVLGILKIKDHVENPTQTPLKDGAIRLAAGGALFALPIIYESMFNTVGDTTKETNVAKLNKVKLGLTNP